MSDIKAKLQGLEEETAEIAAQLEQARQAEDYDACKSLKKRLDAVEKKRARAEEKVRAAEEKRKRTSGRRRPFGPKRPSGAEPLPSPADARVRVIQPKESTKRLMGYEVLHEDGIMRGAGKLYSIALAVDDVNYIGCRAEEQEFVRESWATYLDSLDHSVHLEICLKTRRMDSDVFYDRISMKHVSGDEGGNVLRDEYNAWIREKMNSASRSMDRTRTVVISIEAETYAEAAPLLAHEAEHFTRFIRDLGSDATIQDGQARMDDLCSYTRQDDAPGTQSFEAIHESIGLTTLDLTAPTRAIRLDDGRGDSRMVIGRRWVKTYAMTLDGYGKTMKDSFISDLTSLPYDLSVTWHIRPWETAAAMSAAEAHYSSITEENNAFKLNRSRPERGYFIDDDNLPPAMREAQLEALAFRNDLGTDLESAFGVTTVVCVMGRDEQELEQACGDVEKVFQAHRKPLPDSWSALREQSFATALPTGSCLVPYDRTLTTRPLSQMLMFASTEVFDEGGFLMGINADTRNFIVYNPVLHEHTNSFVLAEPRSGKSFNVKQTKYMQTHLLYPEDDVIGIDPEGELVLTTRAAGGQVVDISDASRDHVNPFDISLDYDASDPDKTSNPIPAKISFIQSLVHMMISKPTDKMVNLIDRACVMIYQKWLEDPCPENMPTFQDLYDYVISTSIDPKDSAAELADVLYRYMEGSLNVFNHKTSVQLEKNLVVFDISSLSSTLKPLALLIIMEHIWVRVTANRRRGKRTWLIVDEFQLLLSDDQAVDQFDRFFSRGGKWDLYLTAITQNVERVLANEKTYYMLQNSPFITLFAQSPASARVLKELLDLSDSQAKSLTTAGKGQGLYWFKNKVLRFDFTMSKKTCPTLCQLFSTTPEDIKRYRVERARAEALRADLPEADLEEPEETPAEQTAVMGRVDESMVPEVGSRRPFPSRAGGPTVSEDAGETPVNRENGPENAFIEPSPAAPRYVADTIHRDPVSRDSMPDFIGEAASSYETDSGEDLGDLFAGSVAAAVAYEPGDENGFVDARKSIKVKDQED